MINCNSIRKEFFFLLLLFPAILFSQEKKPMPTENFYNKSLHYTNKGILYNYSKEQNGLEKLAGISAKEIGCDKAECHVKSCDVCHAKEVEGKMSYSVETAKSEEACKKCHGDSKDSPDVHVKKGMKCMDCHSIREIHGDGKEYNSSAEPGAMDTKCEKCHESINKSISHTIHKGKLDCGVCHDVDRAACHNCHIDTKIKDKKSVSKKMKNLTFLINHNGKVKTANFLSYVYGNKTMITFAPNFGHKVTRAGKTCKECHGTQITKDIQENKFKLARWEKDTLINVEGYIPVVDGMKWDMDYLNYDQGKWTLLKDAAQPIITYSGYCSPLSKEQFEKMAKSRGGK